jgi:DNA polymerase III subunit epsilon
MSGISFTAIDFETANSHRGSACAVGLVKVRDGHIVDTASWLIKPPPGIDDFDPINVELHGIAEQDVQNAADWEMSLEGILQFVCEDPLVAFDAPYDASVMRKATEHQHLDLPAKDFYCALRLAQDHLTLPRHRLSDVLAALDLPPVERHEPRAHALACAQIVLAIAAEGGFTALDEVWEEPTTTVGNQVRTGVGHHHSEVCIRLSLRVSVRPYLPVPSTAVGRRSVPPTCCSRAGLTPSAPAAPRSAHSAPPRDCCCSRWVWRPPSDSPT